jgi:hypothetical protein
MTYSDLLHLVGEWKMKVETPSFNQQLSIPSGKLVFGMYLDAFLDFVKSKQKKIKNLKKSIKK